MQTTRPPGRQPERGVRASESVRVPLTPDELAWVDERRGDTKRATWLRQRALTDRADLEPLRPFLSIALRECAERWDTDPDRITLRTIAANVRENDMMPAVLHLATCLGVPSGEAEPDDDSWRNE